jgi:hypothetical protein
MAALKARFLGIENPVWWIGLGSGLRMGDKRLASSPCTSTLSLRDERNLTSDFGDRGYQSPFGPYSSLIPSA